MPKERNTVRKALAAIVNTKVWHDIRWYCTYDSMYLLDTYTREHRWQVQPEYMQDHHMNAMQSMCPRTGFIDGTSVEVGHLPYHVEGCKVSIALLSCNDQWLLPTRRVIAIYIPRISHDGDTPIKLQHTTMT